jgi:hypothetical protein
VVGFTTKSWDHLVAGKFVADTEAFIGNLKTGVKINSTPKETAITCMPEYGPLFKYSL